MTRLLGDPGRRRAYSAWDVQDYNLADRDRMDAYRRGIEANVGEGDVVIDFGTGSGILAFMAVRAGARKVYAIDEQPVGPARRVAAANGFQQIDFRQLNSRNFEPPEPVDAIIHANVETPPYLSEPIVDDLRELAGRTLKPRGKLLPGRVDLYCEPVQLHAEHWIPLASEHRLVDVDFSALRGFPIGDSYPLAMMLGPGATEQLLCEPEAVATIELGRDPASALPDRIAYSRPAVRAGMLHGFALYFVSYFDEANEFAARPLAVPAKWQLAIFRTESRPVEAGDPITLDLHAPSYRSMRGWRWNWQA